MAQLKVGTKFHLCRCNTWHVHVKNLRNVSPTEPTHLSTKTLGICTSCSGLLPSFRAWDRFRICPRSTDICFSNMERSYPLSVWTERIVTYYYIVVTIKLLEAVLLCQVVTGGNQHTKTFMDDIWVCNKYGSIICNITYVEMFCTFKSQQQSTR